jgi:hypothetical protein
MMRSKERRKFFARRLGLAAAAVLVLNQAARAEEGSLFSRIESQPLDEIWVNPGFYSYHFQRDKGLHDENLGLGMEYRFSTVTSFTAGRFYNSDREYSDYLGFYYQPFRIGSLRLGAAIGGFNGYPKMREGGWFLAAVPVISYEYERVGLNLGIVPTYKDRLYGAFSFQLKVKL